MQEIEQSRLGGDGPRIRAETWFALAIASFIITISAGAFFALWVFDAGSDALMVQRAQAFTPFGAAMLAIVTFCTVAWRGVLNTTQLQQTGEQLNQSRRQNDAKDDENLAKLLMDGTTLIGEDKETHILAGVAALSAVVSSPKGTFAPQAMDILGGVVRSTYNLADKRDLFEAAKSAMDLGVELKRYGTRDLVIDVSGVQDKNGVAINGLRSIKYVGARFRRWQFEQFKKPSSVQFNSCRFTDIREVKVDIRQSGCTFVRCKIKSFTELTISYNEFEDCDFSGAVLRRPPRTGRRGVPFANLSGKGNFFRDGEAPQGSDDIDWTTILTVAPKTNNDDEPTLPLDDRVEA
ncbi:hypothetical protein PWG15_12680 [Ensifer adhaerens]|uniref:hypothetical protein n=1 Tax=Ensifer adhaerens TaxID=106592 RepID=UPI0023AA138F|nr:hypothetical protein [Ensifer adhaerens]WDZ75472.1 hypothetical protein PWG15_12680 [Ensifer adhaerens]